MGVGNFVKHYNGKWENMKEGKAVQRRGCKLAQFEDRKKDNKEKKNKEDRERFCYIVKMPPQGY